MSIVKKIGIGLLLLVLIVAVAGWLVTRPDSADLAWAKVTGTDPQLAEPERETFPTVRIAEPVGWPTNAAPTPAAGLAVNRFAEGLDHPRTMLTLPNGDVLVSLTRAPKMDAPGEDNWIKKKIQEFLFRKAGSGGTSPDQVVLLRDADGDGRAEGRFVLGDDFASPGQMIPCSSPITMRSGPGPIGWAKPRSLVARRRSWISPRGQTTGCATCC
jgi:glucose/arabinose dehydrogenase